MNSVKLLEHVPRSRIVVFVEFVEVTRATIVIFNRFRAGEFPEPNSVDFVGHELDIQRRDDVVSGGGLTFKNVDGVLEPSFRGIPVRICDSLLETEATVS